MHTELPIWISKICNLDKNAINFNALMCEIHRTMKTSKTKRGERKRAFLDMKFPVPVQTQSIVTETSTSAIFSKVTQQRHEKKTEEKLSERRSKVKELTEKNKHLKRKYERMFGKQEAATMIKKKKDKELSESKSELKQLKKQLQNSEQKIKMYKKQKDKYKQSYFEKCRKVSQLEKKV